MASPATAATNTIPPLPDLTGLGLEQQACDGLKRCHRCKSSHFLAPQMLNQTCAFALVMRDSCSCCGNWIAS